MKRKNKTLSPTDKFIKFLESKPPEIISREISKIEKPDTVVGEDPDIRMDFGKFSIWLRENEAGGTDLDGSLPKSMEQEVKRLAKKFKLENSIRFR